MRPFVLIAALPRTDSTLTAEALTDLPRSFSFREPRVFLGHVQLRPPDLERLAEAGVAGVVGRDERTPVAPEEAARWFLERVAAPLWRTVEQVGIKEIRYSPGWRAALDALAGAKPVRVVALGPRPARHLPLPRGAVEGPAHPAPRPVRARGGRRQPASGVRPLARRIEATGALTVRYEDLCRDPEALRGVRAFVDSPVLGDGAIGSFKQSNRAVHGHEITERRVERWREERDAALLTAAHETRDRLEEYCRFWGYT